MEPHLPDDLEDDLDQMIAARTEANPDFPAMVEAAAAARVERGAKLGTANEGAPDIVDEETLARPERDGDVGSPS